MKNLRVITNDEHVDDIFQQQPQPPQLTSNGVGSLRGGVGADVVRGPRAHQRHHAV